MSGQHYRQGEEDYAILGDTSYNLEPEGDAQGGEGTSSHEAVANTYAWSPFAYHGEVNLADWRGNLIAQTTSMHKYISRGRPSAFKEFFKGFNEKDMLSIPSLIEQRSSYYRTDNTEDLSCWIKETVNRACTLRELFPGLRHDEMARVVGAIGQHSRSDKEGGDGWQQPRLHTEVAERMMLEARSVLFRIVTSQQEGGSYVDPIDHMAAALAMVAYEDGYNQSEEMDKVDGFLTSQYGTGWSKDNLQLTHLHGPDGQGRNTCVWDDEKQMELEKMTRTQIQYTKLLLPGATQEGMIHFEGMGDWICTGVPRTHLALLPWATEVCRRMWEQ